MMMLNRSDFLKNSGTFAQARFMVPRRNLKENYQELARYEVPSLELDVTRNSGLGTQD
jgi:hypothetical protein